MSALEELRAAHEDMESLHEELQRELRSVRPRSKRQIIFQDHKLKFVATEARKRAKLVHALGAVGAA